MCCAAPWYCRFGTISRIHAAAQTKQTNPLAPPFPPPQPCPLNVEPWAGSQHPAGSRFARTLHTRLFVAQNARRKKHTTPPTPTPSFETRRAVLERCLGCPLAPFWPIISAQCIVPHVRIRSGFQKREE